jgi:hypothetical protein
VSIVDGCVLLVCSGAVGQVWCAADGTEHTGHAAQAFRRAMFAGWPVARPIHKWGRDYGVDEGVCVPRA